MTMIPLLKNDDVAINMFTADMNQIIGNITDILIEIFNVFKKGNCGNEIRDSVLNLFGDWLSIGLLPKIDETTNFIIDVLGRDSDLSRIIKSLRKELPFSPEIDDIIVKIIAENKRGELLENAVKKYIWNIYSKLVNNFIVQTAHFMVGRLLMYFVGSDKGAWETINLTVNIPTPYLDFYWTLRRAMSNILPSIYYLNEFDWLYISDNTRQKLYKKEANILNVLERKLDIALKNVYDKLRRYQYSGVDTDLWKSVYQAYLPSEEVNKLGFVTTPDEIVDLILDLAGYHEDAENLCQKMILDPACGSGTFLVEALIRLRKHFEKNKKCHKRDTSQPIWVWEKYILEKFVTNIKGIDIHPFATFLTTLNLIFQIIDLYASARHHYPDFSLSLDIVTHDALSERPDLGDLRTYINSRRKEAAEKSKKFAELYDKRFDFVIGNPPWGAVLRGKIGPLGDEGRRNDYRRRFNSATGKYDIFVLFMERGINWLNDEGILGMITQVTYVSSDFGKGIQEIIRNNTIVNIFVDLQTIGDIIFPDWTNYPAITILKKGNGIEELILVEVNEV